MVRGKHGFERIVWAFKNVLNTSVTWLLCDPKGQIGDSETVTRFSPVVKTMKPSIETMESVLEPQFPDTVEQDDTATAVELLEWLSLVTSGSPRIQQTDQIDSHLSRYRVPSESEDPSGETIGRQVQDLVKFRWHGLIPPQFALKVLSTTLKARGPSWFALSTSAFDGTAYAFLQDKQHTMTWEYSD